MHRFYATCTTVALCTLPLVTSPVAAASFSGHIAGEYRYFPQTPDYPTREKGLTSLSTEFEYYTEINDDTSFTFKPFIRVDERDDERSHQDIREAMWQTVGDDWELRIGIGKVFWGVTESRHLVDIINQSDSVEDLDGEDKLGQPMINFSHIRDWGTVDFFVLPYFRERTVTGEHGRPRLPLVIDHNNPVYESGEKEQHIDFAVRWSHTLGDWDIGVSHFNGTSRDPRLVPTLKQGNVVLTPHYDIINQTGLDLQATLEDWLLKLEYAHRRSKQQDNFNAAVTGVEYTFVGVMESDMDVGVVSEWLYDDRDDEADHPFQNDLMLGIRLTLNDAQSTDALIGVIQDLDGGGRAFSLEANRRIGDSFKLSVDARINTDTADDPRLDSLAHEDMLRVELGYYF